MSKSAEKRSKRYKILIILLVIGYVIALFIDFFMFVGSGFDSYNYLKVEPPAKNYTRLDNPNDFNEDCYVDEEYSYNSDDFKAGALKLFELTGIQAYYHKFNIEEVDDLKSDNDVTNYVKARVDELYTDDPYALVIYESNSKKIPSDEGYNGYEYICSYSNTYYGKGLKSILDSDGRAIFSELWSNKYKLSEDYTKDEKAQALIWLGEILINRKTLEIGGNNTVLHSVTGAMLPILTIIFVTALILMIRHKVHIDETVEILEASNRRDFEEDQDLIKKYKD